MSYRCFSSFASLHSQFFQYLYFWFPHTKPSRPPAFAPFPINPTRSRVYEMFVETWRTSATVSPKMMALTATVGSSIQIRSSSNNHEGGAFKPLLSDSWAISKKFWEIFDLNCQDFINIFLAVFLFEYQETYRHRSRSRQVTMISACRARGQKRIDELAVCGRFSPICWRMNGNPPPTCCFTPLKVRRCTYFAS